MTTMLFIIAKQSTIFTSYQGNETYRISYLCIKDVQKSAVLIALLPRDCNIKLDHFSICSKNTNNFAQLIRDHLLIARDNFISFT